MRNWICVGLQRRYNCLTDSGKGGTLSATIGAHNCQEIGRISQLEIALPRYSVWLLHEDNKLYLINFILEQFNCI